MTPRLRSLPVVLFAMALAFGVPSLVAFYTDWLWFGEVGFQGVFERIVTTQVWMFAWSFVVAAAWLMVNVRVALASVSDMAPVFTTPQGVTFVLPSREQLQRLGTAVVLALAIVMGLIASGQWLTWLSWRHGSMFGHVDPVLDQDVSFYVFSLPLLQLLRGLAQGLIALGAVCAAVVYFVSGALRVRPPGSPWMTHAARRHLAGLAAAFFLTLALGAWLGRSERLLMPSGLIHGAAYADVQARMPAALLLAGAGILGAALSGLHAMSRKRWPLPVAVAVYVVVLFGGEIYAVALQRLVVAPNEQVREAPYIEHNISATRRAFGLDTIEAEELSGEASLTRDDITRNRATLDNVRLWDHQPLLETFGQLQEIRTYYDFVSVDNDRYEIDGAYRQVMLSARELNAGSLPNRTWVNERLTFTHGYGLTLGPVNEVTPEGLPKLFVANLPPATTADLRVEEPSLYFGELTNDYVIVNTRTREFHYPQGEDNVFTHYTGQGGLALDSLWRRLLFALRFGSYQIVLNTDISTDSRILFNRNIRERVQRIAPFLRFDADPYLAVADGRLFWISDAYTVSGRYPYSTPAVAGVNYIRNAVKIVIDAYHGTTTFYLADQDDPLIATYGRIFPDLFQPIGEMPPALRAHVRYPEDLFAVQASMFATYHMTQPSVFYNREDQWEIPVIDEGREAQPMQPYFTIMRLPGEDEAEFIQMLPFTPRRRDNLAAWLVARSDGEHYGRLRVFQFPKQKLVFGPRQVVARINQDQVIAPQVTLWSQQGSSVIWGTLMVIPIEESLIYVRPLYLRAAGGRIPELTRVVVAYENRIVMEDGLEGALVRLFGGTAPEGPPREPPLSSPTPLAQLAGEAKVHYDRAMDALRAGDWAKYGEALRSVGEVLEQMARP